MTFIRVLQPWALVSLFLLFIASALAVPEEGCPVPDALKNAPQLKLLVGRLCDQLSAPMDFRRGTGTNDVARQARKFAEGLKEVATGISVEEAEAAGFTFDNIRQMALDINGGKAWLIEVDAYEEAVAQGNKRLHGSGIDFFVFVQSPRAALTEAYRIYISRFPSRVITPEALHLLSSRVYNDILTNEIHLPLPDSELEAGREKLKTANASFKLIADKSVRGAEDVILPPLDEPLPNEKTTYGRLQLTRNVISPTLAIVAGLPGGVTWDAAEGIRITSEVVPKLAGGTLAAGLEFQFIQWSNRWAWFWNKYGLAGNIGVNLAYGSLVTAAKLATELGMGMPSSVTLEEFIKKTMVISTVGFVSSFGAAQIMTSKMRNRGEITESQRFLFETVSVLVNNFGRVLALTGAGLGLAGGELFNLWNMKFDSGEALGFGIQLAYLAAITAPLTLKYLWGDSTYDTITREMLLPEISRNTGTCWGWLSWMSDWFSPRRRPKS